MTVLPTRLISIHGCGADLFAASLCVTMLAIPPVGGFVSSVHPEVRKFLIAVVHYDRLGDGTHRLTLVDFRQHDTPHAAEKARDDMLAGPWSIHELAPDGTV